MPDITVRPLTERDSEGYFQIVKLPTVQQGAQLGEINSLEEARQILLHQLANETVWGVLQNDQLIGVVSWAPMVGQQGEPDENNLLLSYFLAPHYWGQGIMSEAIKEVLASPLAGKTVWAEILPDNTASKTVLQRNGFVLADEYTEPFAATLIQMYRHDS